MAHAALGNPNALGELLLGDIELLDPVTDEGNPFIHIHRWHDTDCLRALNKHSVLFLIETPNTKSINFSLDLFPLAFAGIRMKPPKKDETDLDSEAARRALDYYLNPPPSRPSLDNRIWTLHDGVSSEQAHDHAVALLRCAAATAHETATHQPQGMTREILFALMHMMNMARALLEHKQSVQVGGE